MAPSVTLNVVLLSQLVPKSLEFDVLFFLVFATNNRAKSVVYYISVSVVLIMLPLDTACNSTRSCNRALGTLLLGYINDERACLLQVRSATLVSNSYTRPGTWARLPEPGGSTIVRA